MTGAPNEDAGGHAPARAPEARSGAETLRGRLQGALAAAVTPLTDGGAEVDADGIGRVVDLYAHSGLDGMLALGSAGEGILLSPAERRRAAKAFVAAAGTRLPVLVHCGAQSTRDTCDLAAHAAEEGAAAVAVIPPPYFALDGASILRHLRAAAGACAPLPFYAYEFAARSGYAIPLPILLQLREEAPNLVGLKVSDTPFDRVEPYLTLGLDVFIGAESLICSGLRGGAVGAVSALAAALPELTLAAVRDGSVAASERAGRVRGVLNRFPLHAALKRVLQLRGVAIGGDVRAPLRGLGAGEVAALDSLLSQPGSEFFPALPG